MDQITVRPFRYSDLDAIIRIAHASFAEEMIVQGVTPAAFEQQMRLMTRGRMIPFTVLSALSGITWEVLVAEVGGAVVGCYERGKQPGTNEGADGAPDGACSRSRCYSGDAQRSIQLVDGDWT
jgi:hypothetical protein